jgi:deoxycytidine triphosphate deaminase
MLVDFQIEKLCRQKTRPLVTPYDPTMLRSYGLELRVGREILFSAPYTAMPVPNIAKIKPWARSSRPKSIAALSLKDYTEKAPWKLKPGWWALLRTAESFALAPTMTVTLTITPQAMAYGFGLTTPQYAGGIDGPMTVGVVNHNTYDDLPLYWCCPLFMAHFNRIRFQPKHPEAGSHGQGITMMDRAEEAALWGQELSNAFRSVAQGNGDPVPTFDNIKKALDGGSNEPRLIEG